MRRNVQEIINQIEKKSEEITCHSGGGNRTEKQIREKFFKYNQLCPNGSSTKSGKMGKETIITPPFWCGYGYNITVDDYFYSNHGMIITDGAKVTFGDNVFIAPE